MPKFRRQLAQFVENRNHGSCRLVEILDGRRKGKCHIHLQKVKKKGPENYKSVNLTSLLGKIIKKVLLEHISGHMKGLVVSVFGGIKNIFRKCPYQPGLSSYLSLFSTGGWSK